MREVSHTQLSMFQRCEQKYNYRYVLGYEKQVYSKRIELGIWIHELLAGYYRALKCDSDGLRAAEDVQTRLLHEWWDPLFDEEKEQLGPDLPDKAYEIFKRYVSRWASSDAAWKRIISVEQEIKAVWPGTDRVFTAKCDLIVTDKLGCVWVIDHKVVESIPDESVRDIDPQGARYVIAVQQALRRLGMKSEVGMVYDYIRSKLPTVPKELKGGGLSKDSRIDTDYETYINEIRKRGLNEEDYKDVLERIVVSGKPFFERWPVPKTGERIDYEVKNVAELIGRIEEVDRKGRYVRALDSTRCSWDCEYKDLCLAEIRGADIDSILKSQYTVRREQDG